MIGCEKEGFTESPPLTLNFSDIVIQESPEPEELSLGGRPASGFLGRELIPVDLDGEGVSGILLRDSGSMTYFAPEGGGRYECGRSLNLPSGAGSFQFMDLDGDGRLQLASFNSGMQGFFDRDGRGGWLPFRPFEKRVSGLEGPLETASLSGDGKTDLVSVGKGKIRVSFSDGRKGWKAPVEISVSDNFPRNSGRRDELAAFCDFYGDGMTHRIRISDSSIDVWPGLGRGRFGERRRVKNAPFFEGGLDVSRLRLADTTGTGTADIIYLFRKKAVIFLNEQGESFSEPFAVSLPDIFSDIDGVSFGDIFGEGRACMIFTKAEPETRSFLVDLAGRGHVKPFLLVKADTKTGALRLISYDFSSNFSIGDKKNSRLFSDPFPRTVAKRIVDLDEVAETKISKDHIFRHGRFDFAERRFAGFGMTEVRTKSLKSDGSLIAPESLTRIWRHVGGFEEAASEFKDEFFSGFSGFEDSKTFFHLIDGAGFETSRESRAALAGKEIRREVFGKDGSEKYENIPFSVSETRYMVSETFRGEKSSFFVRPCEKVSADLERNPDDPRIFHVLDLKWDDNMNLTKSCSAAYQRKGEKSSGRRVFLTDISYASSFLSGVKLAGAPSERIVSAKPALKDPAGNIYGYEEIKGALLSYKAKAEEIASCERIFYTDGKNKLEFGKASEHLLVSRRERAEFCISKIKKIFSPVFSEKKFLEGLLTGLGGYSNADIPGFYSDPGVRTEYESKDNYFVALKLVDQFGGATNLKYDKFFLNVTGIKDPEGNEEKIEYGFFSTLPEKRTDIRKNKSETLFDGLGSVKSVSFNKGGLSPDRLRKAEQDRLKAEKSLEGKNPEDILKAIASGREKFLGEAAYFCRRDLFSWKNYKIPVHNVVLTSDRYPAVTSSGEFANMEVVYSDGFGQEIRKISLSGDKGTKWSVSAASDYSLSGRPSVIRIRLFTGSSTPRSRARAVHGISSSTLSEERSNRPILPETAARSFSAQPRARTPGKRPSSTETI